MQDLDSIRSALGTPSYDAEDILLYTGDCLDLLQALPRESVALTVTSPPYNIGKEYEADRHIDEYIEWCGAWMTEIHSVTCPHGAFWLNLGYFSFPGKARAVPIPYLLWDKSPFFLIQEVVWHYGAGVAARHAFSPRNEKFLWYVKNPDDYYFDLDSVRDPNVKYPNQFKNGRRKVNPLGKNPTDVWTVPKVTSGRQRSAKERTAHPAQFPVAVVERIVKACSRPGDVVVDPFVGSGTMAEVCLRLGRKFVGFDITPAYIEIAVERLSAAQEDGVQAAFALED